MVASSQNTAKEAAHALGVNGLYGAIERELKAARAAKTYKVEIPIEGEQGGTVTVGGKNVVMLASNNYLGLANHPRVRQAALVALDQYGFGMASVRFLCGTQKVHLELEQKIAQFLGTEDAILHSSCFAANEAFFTALLTSDFGQQDYKDVIYSDQLNHASIIDGVRLARIATKTTEVKAYKHNDINQLQSWLESDGNSYRARVIVTDGVFSMEGEYAPLDKFVELAKKHDALLIVDESHASGVLGRHLAVERLNNVACTAKLMLSRVRLGRHLAELLVDSSQARNRSLNICVRSPDRIRSQTR